MKKMKKMIRQTFSISALLLAVFFLAANAQANSFTVHGWEWGSGQIQFDRDGTSESVRGALIDATLENYGHGYSFCVDLDHTISGNTYEGLVLDPSAATTPSMNYAGAAAIANFWTYQLESLGSRGDAISGVQAAIWDVLYGDALTITSLGSGAQKAYEQVMAQQYQDYGKTVLVDFGRKQDQVFTPAVPEPSAALVFALGSLLIGTTARRK